MSAFTTHQANAIAMPKISHSEHFYILVMWRRLVRHVCSRWDSRVSVLHGLANPGPINALLREPAKRTKELPKIVRAYKLINADDVSNKLDQGLTPYFLCSKLDKKVSIDGESTGLAEQNQ